MCKNIKGHDFYKNFLPTQYAYKQNKNKIKGYWTQQICFMVRYKMYISYHISLNNNKQILPFFGLKAKMSPTQSGGHCQKQYSKSINITFKPTSFC